MGLVVLTGAGVSADSGVATFRGAGGLWEGRRVEEVATPEAWAHDPERVWRFYQQRRASLRGVAPNPAHVALAELERRLAARGEAFTLITQNVDDLHERAGATPIHMHGELAVLRCEGCGVRRRELEFLDEQRFLACANCGFARLRPDVVWFGEMPLHMDAIEVAMASCSRFLSIGTSGLVYPAAGLLAAARSVGAETFVNSLDVPENLDASDRFLVGRAADVVPQLLAGW